MNNNIITEAELQELKLSGKEAIKLVKDLIATCDDIKQEYRDQLEFLADHPLDHIARAVYRAERDEDGSDDDEDDEDWEDSVWDRKSGEDAGAAAQRKLDRLRRRREQRQDEMQTIIYEISSSRQSDRAAMYRKHKEIYDRELSGALGRMYSAKEKLRPAFVAYLNTALKLQEAVKQNKPAIEERRSKWYIKMWEKLMGTVYDDVKRVRGLADIITGVRDLSARQFARDFLAVDYFTGVAHDLPEATAIVSTYSYMNIIL